MTEMERMRGPHVGFIADWPLKGRIIYRGDVYYTSHRVGSTVYAIRVAPTEEEAATIAASKKKEEEAATASKKKEEEAATASKKQDKRRRDMGLDRLFRAMCGALRTGMEVVVVPEPLPLVPNKIEPFDDPYRWGSQGKEQGDGWVLHTRGDLLGGSGDCYRVFSRSLAVRPEIWREAVEYFVLFRAVSMRFHAAMDAPVTAEQMLNYVEQLWRYVPANWPKP